MAGVDGSLYCKGSKNGDVRREELKRLLFLVRKKGGYKGECIR